MIELYSAHHLILDNGREASLDLDGLCREVRDSCTAVGMRDPWLAEQMVFALEDYFFTRTDGGETKRPKREEIDALVARLLLAAGYGDVAAEFSRRRQLIAPDASAVAPLPWNEARVSQLLRRGFALPGELLGMTAGRVLDKLAELRFRQVTDALILELAGELLRETPTSPATAPGSPWLFLPDHWDRVFTGDSARFCRAGVLRPHPVSRLLPAARLTLDLPRLAAGLESVPLTELQFWPELRRAAQAAGRALLVMREQIRRHVTLADRTPVRVLLAGAPTLVRVYFPSLTRTAERHLVLELLDGVKQDVQPGFDAPLLVSFERGQ